MGMISFAVGYALFYYGVVLFQQYDANQPSQTTGIPLSILMLGSWANSPGFAGGKYAHPPFMWS
jgi:hypothetical protein